MGEALDPPSALDSDGIIVLGNRVTRFDGSNYFFLSQFLGTRKRYRLPG